MRALTKLTLLAAACCLAGGASADHDSSRCSTQMLAGRWLFATGVGHQALNPAAPSDITALGTMNIHRNGTLDGVFDVTFDKLVFRGGVLYSGTVVVNPDCTGTLSFVTSNGTARTDSIAVLNRYEIWGMSQDTKNLWTYQARRIAGGFGFSAD
jgi:hypothetical protein